MTKIEIETAIFIQKFLKRENIHLTLSNRGIKLEKTAFLFGKIFLVILEFYKEENTRERDEISYVTRAV